MKKHLCMLAVVALASSAFAQGTVTFASGSNLVRSQGANDPSPVPVAINGGWAQLYWAPVATVDPSPWNTGTTTLSAWLGANSAFAAVPESIKALNGPLAGRFNGGSVTIPGGAGGIAPGANVKAFVLAWTGSFASADAAFAGGALMGASTAFTVDTGDPTTVPPGTAGSMTGAGGFAGMTLTPVSIIPEPSTLTLAGLGIAALLAIRRRK